MRKPNRILPALLLATLCAFHSASAQQDKPCKEINVSVEITKKSDSQKSLKLHFQDKGDFKVKILTSTGKLIDLKADETKDLEIGEYDLIITDTGDTNRCPYHKKIKVERQ